MVGDSYRLLARALGMGPQGWLSSIREREERRVMQGSRDTRPGSILAESTEPTASWLQAGRDEGWKERAGPVSSPPRH